jgi:hypothetical protein
MLTRDHAALDGQLVFRTLTKRTGRYEVAVDELRIAFPGVLEARVPATNADGSPVVDPKTGEPVLRPTVKGSILTTFVWLFGYTVDIDFQLAPDAPEDLRNFQAWWTAVVPHAEARALFEGWLTVRTEAVERLWSEAILATRPAAPARADTQGAAGDDGNPTDAPANTPGASTT